jgi:predicted transcriptional regulator
MKNHVMTFYSSCLPLREKYKTFNYSNLFKKYRSHFEITALVLEAARDDSATGFSIMTHASINCAQLKKYLQFLTEIGFINVGIKEGRVLYRASEKGLEFLKQYYILLEMLFSTYAQNKQTNMAHQAIIPNSTNRIFANRT